MNHIFNTQSLFKLFCLSFLTYIASPLKAQNPTTNPCDTDKIKPVFQTCPSDINVTTAGTNVIVDWTIPKATDNCIVANVSLGNYSPGFAFPLGTSTVVYTAQDLKGNTSTCQFKVIVSSQIVQKDICANPSTCIYSQNGVLFITGIKTSAAFIQVFNSNWSPVYNQQVDKDSIAITNLIAGKYNVKVTVLETGGRWPAVCNAVLNDVNVTNTGTPCDTDTQAPTFANCPQNINLNTTSTTAIAIWTAPTASDNCTTSPSVSSTHNSGFAFPIGTTTVTYTAKDAKNNSSTCSFNIVVAKTIPKKVDLVVANIPIITFISQDFNKNPLGIVVKNIGDTAMTGSFEVKLFISEDSIYSSNDSLWVQGNADFIPLDINATATITLFQNTFAPKVIYGKDYWIIGVVDTKNVINELNENNNVLATKANVSFNNLHPSILLSKKTQNSPNITPNSRVNIGDTLNVFQFHNSYRSPSSEFPNIKYRIYFSKDTLFSIDDYMVETRSGSIETTFPPSGYYVSQFNTSVLSNYLSGTYYFVVEYDFDNILSESNEKDNWAYIPIDWVNNSIDSCVNDAIPPRISNCPQNINLTTTGTTTLATWTAPTASDNCTATPSVSSTHNSGFAFPIGTTTVTYTAKDAKNNSSTCSFKVVVTQQINTGDVCANPSANVKGAAGSITVSGITTSAAVVQIFNSAWTTVYNQQMSGNTVTVPNLSAGTYNVKVTVLGAGGKWPSICSNLINNIIVTNSSNPCDTDSTAPVFTNCPQNITIETVDTFAIVTWTAPNATDNCTASPLSANCAITPCVTVSSNFTSGSKFSIGSKTVVYTATDAKGNKGTCSFIVNVVQKNNCRYTDSLALVDLYNSTNGANWTTKWDLTTPISTWYGLRFNQNGCVNAINLARNNLVGSIPNLNLPNLQDLFLDYNQLSGSIPNLNLPNLQILYLYANQLSGNIPNLDLPNLKTLYLFDNQLNGNIPNFNLLNLENLNLCSNKLNGNIPNFNLPNLKHLGLCNNQLYGDIPNLILPKLCTLYLSNNKLSGNIPNFNLPNLESISLGYNQLIGNIPNFNLPNLKYLTLNHNQLTGNIPSFNLPNLVMLDINTNFLIGNIPDFYFPNLQGLYLNNNQLSGNIPNFNLPILRELYLSYNQLSGNIPNFKFKSIDRLLLRDNQLSGNIPEFSFPISIALDLANNQLSGCISPKLKSLCNSYVDISNNPSLPNGGDWIAFCTSETGACTTPTNDLSINIGSPSSNYRQYTNVTINVAVTNTGTAPMSNIKIKFPYPAQTVNGGKATPSVGTWNDYCSGGVLCYEWNIPTLAANSTANLSVPLFVLGATAPIVATATLVSSTPVDTLTSNNLATLSLLPATTTQQLASPNRPKPSQFIPVVIQTIAPNPTEGDVLIDVESIVEKEVRFDFYNTLGKVVKSELREVKKGLNHLNFDFWNTQSGIYFIQTTEGQGRGVPLKFVKL